MIDDNVQRIIDALLMLQVKSKRQVLKTYRSTMHPAQRMKRICQSVEESKQALRKLKGVVQKIHQESSDFMKLSSKDGNIPQK